MNNEQTLLSIKQKSFCFALLFLTSQLCSPVSLAHFCTTDFYVHQFSEGVVGCAGKAVTMKWISCLSYISHWTSFMFSAGKTFFAIISLLAWFCMFMRHRFKVINLHLRDQRIHDLLLLWEIQNIHAWFSPIISSHLVNPILSVIFPISPIGQWVFLVW
jgi:hypothetical protein